MSDHLYSYLDDLLRLQSRAADRHDHKGVLGAVRENFVVQVLSDRIDDIKIYTGEVVGPADNFGQNDVIIRKRGTVNTELGGQVRINAQDCSGIIEVKSNAKATEITEFNQKAQRIKSICPNAVCGVVCYKLHNRKDTILKRMGHVFDADIEGFIPDSSIDLEYQEIDFVLCLDEDTEISKGHEYSKTFFIKKHLDGRYGLFLDPPYMKYFLREMNAVANPQVAA